MNPADRRLLIRVAQRMERQAKEAYEAAGKTESAKATRDNIVGDVLDLRDFVAREGEDRRVARYEFLMGNRQKFPGTILRELSENNVKSGETITRADVERWIDEALAAPPPLPPASTDRTD